MIPRIENVEAYLRVVVRNAAHRARAKGKRGGELARDGEIEAAADRSEVLDADRPLNPEEMTQRANDARKRLDAVKARLRPRDAVAFALLVEDGLSIEEVAKSLGTTANNVYQMRHRILAVVQEFSGKADSSSMLVRG